ncbi:MAG: hypothetical protein ACXAEU_10215 [Candidatus Hodarchaeales archaeon]|jgi:hypothetical protein
MVIGFTGHWSNHVGRAGGYASNYAVVTHGSWVHGNWLADNQVENIVQHETSHLYGAYDRNDWEWWDGQPSVMDTP